MISEEVVSKAIKGAYDLHVHSEPDLIKRKGDDFEFARLALEAGMAGIGIKSHYFPTVERAAHLRSMFPALDAVGGVCLNNYVGGLNPMAVEVAGRANGKVIWMPTVDSFNEYNAVRSGNKQVKHYWSSMQDEIEKSGIQFRPIRVVLENGKFAEGVESILEIIKKYDMILATGHLSPAESIRLIEKAHDSGLRKFIITHPDSPTTFFDLDQQKYLGRFGVFFERSYRIPAINFTTWDYFISEIKYTGPSRNVLATDLGQLDSPYPAEGMKELVKKLLENGFSLEEVRRMCVENYVFLLGRRGHN